ncbi:MULTISPECIES: hypothetical protein [Microbispora]|uniref:MobA-like NTP transferase domain-containing protein n=1 Tax=Microbispora catharanthi TaxID=1712871 RepID=A0A5N6BGK2_9ACTN|nr:hypothetical protein [Microbispora sp. H10830]KAB8180207.1 hypothetical protein FH610_033490 [Microbispora catharanthi]GLX08428.1 hypothetical protein Misp03_53540 [Microbispora sp. NBRC 16548]
MTRVAAVLVTPGMAEAAPPGVDPAEFLTAMAEDTYEMVAGLELVRPVILSAGVPGLEDIAWPGTPVLPIASPADAFAALPQEEEGVIVSADAPDLPPLLIGKLFRELGRAHLAVCPAEGGGAVAVAARLPVPEWAAPDFDEPDVVAAMRRRAPGPRMVATGPGWHRLRKPQDVARLDPGLEGWDNTRALLT